jgi:hypothetical protein
MSFSNPLFKRIYANVLLAPATPVRGSVVYRKLGPAEHTGIFITKHKIVQLSSNGQIRYVDFQEFVGSNPFNQIYVACDNSGRVLHRAQIADRAEQSVGRERNYNLLFDNCHQFSSGCVTGDFENVDNYFVFLEHTIEKEFGCELEWRVIDAPWT